MHLKKQVAAMPSHSIELTPRHFLIKSHNAHYHKNSVIISMWLIKGPDLVSNVGRSGAYLPRWVTVAPLSHCHSFVVFDTGTPR